MYKNKTRNIYEVILKNQKGIFNLKEKEIIKYKKVMRSFLKMILYYL